MKEKLTEALTEPIKKISSNFCNVCEEKISTFLKKEKIKKEEFFRDYLIKTYDTIGKTKTLLYKDIPQQIERFCVNTNLCIISYKNQKPSERTISTETISNILKLSKRIIITGTGGMGKTILMKYIFINCIKQTDLVPVFIELRDLNDFGEKEWNIFDLVYNNLIKYGVKMDNQLYKISLEKGCYLILFDGFDEMKSEISNNIRICGEI